MWILKIYWLDITVKQQKGTDTICKHGALKVVENIVEREALAVLAHVDDVKGAYITLKGTALKQFFNEASYSAIETVNGEIPEGLAISKGFKRIPACYQASDNPDSSDSTKHSCDGIGTKYMYFKLDKDITLEGLRQCFIDPPVRIHKMGTLETMTFPKIMNLKVSEGFLKHQNILFHQGLNSIIGGKGVGKSLIVEFIRFALDQPSKDSSILNITIVSLIRD